MSTQKNKIQELNKRFGIKGVIELIEKNGLICISIKNRFSSCEVYLHGAHITSFAPYCDQELLWVSKNSYFEKNKAIRGGVPLCWPWFGAHPSDSSKPSHGFARISEWDILKLEPTFDGGVRIILELLSNDETLKMWPHKFRLQYTIMVGQWLKMQLTTQNIDSSPFKISSALHSYFKISNIANIAIHGLENTSYIDLLDDNKEKKQNGLIKFDTEVDRIYTDKKGLCIIDDPDLKRKIIIDKQSGENTVVWNPWIKKSKRMIDFADDEYKNMVCVETSNAFNDKTTIAPGEENSLIGFLDLVR